MTSDAELLHRYAAEGSEEAFTQVVDRYFDLVYFAALRQVWGDKATAEEVSQEAFVALAIRAKSGAAIPLLAGWLHTVVRYKAAHVVQANRRRQIREQTAAMIESVELSDERRADWEKLRPLIDRVLEEQRPLDRDIVLRRFFQGRSFPDIGRELGISAEAVRFRLGRACDKMRRSLRRRGVESTVAALATSLSALAESHAPAETYLRVAGASLAKASTWQPSLALRIFKVMTATKPVLGTVTVVGILTGAFWRHENELARHIGLAAAFAEQASQVEQQDLDHWSHRMAAANSAYANLESAISGIRSKIAEARPNGGRPAHRGRVRTIGSARTRTVDPRVATDPQIQAAAAMVVKSLFARRYGHFLATHGFDAGQTGQMLDLMVQAEEMGTGGVSISLRPSSISSAQIADQMNALWGSPAVEQAYRDYTRTYLVREVATDLASNLYYTDTPLTSDQSDQLTNILAQSSTGYTNGGQANKGAIDWSLALPQAQTLLSPPQFEMLQAQATLLSQKVWYTGPQSGLPASVYAPATSQTSNP